MTLAEIPRQQPLPLRTAVRIVARGIKLRLGRSLVTLAGVGLGIAFLMATFTGEALKRGVASEDARREATSRAYGLLVGLTGPLHDKKLGLVVSAPPSDADLRLLRRIAEDAPLRLTPAPGSAPLPLKLGALTAPSADYARDASAILVLGAGPIPQLTDGAALRAAMRTPLLVYTVAYASFTPAGIQVASTDVPAPPEEEAKRAADARRAAVQSRWIVVISLLVTAMGIANAMLMSVTERFRDIGTMKCLGALSSLVRTLFLLEAAFMGAVGGVAGVAGGFLFTVATYAALYGPSLALGAVAQGALLLTGKALLSLGLGVTLSVLAALYPAGVAARMVPADALRSSV
jgi:putative ABC transport system permease protein